MKITVSILLLLITLSSIAQSTFEKIYGHASGIFVQPCSDDGYIIGGGDSIYGFLLKVDKDGDTTWLHTGFPVIPNALRQTTDSGFVFVGDKADTALVIKTNDSGVVEWTSGIYDLTGNSYDYTAINIFQEDSGFAIGSQLFRQQQDVPYTISFLDTGGIRLLTEFEIDVTNTSGIIIPASKLQRTNNNGFIMAGNAFSPGLGSIIMDVGRLDSAGNTDWLKTYSDTAGVANIIVNAISQSPDGGFFLGGNSALFSPGIEIFIMKLDSAGDSTWTKTFGPGSFVDLVATKDSGCIIVCDSAGTGKIHLYRLDSSGNLLWVRIFSGSGTAYANHVFELSDEGILIIGTTGNKVYFVRTDSLGRLQPSSTITVSGSTTICPGHSVTLSASPGYTYLWSTSETSQSITVSQEGDYYAYITSSLGAQITSDTVHVSIYPDVPPIISQTGLTLYSTAAITYQWSLNGHQITNADSIAYVPQVGGNYTVTVIDSNGCISQSATFAFIMPGVDESNSELNSFIFRNTFEQLEIISTGKNMKLRLYSICGNLLEEYLPAAEKNSIVTIDLHTYTNGIYILEAIDMENCVRQKFGHFNR